MQTKKWFQSKTIWGLIIATLGFILSRFLQVDVQLPQDATFEDLKSSGEIIANANGNIQVLASQVMIIVGILISFVGRVKADTKITL